MSQNKNRSAADADTIADAAAEAMALAGGNVDEAIGIAESVGADPAIVAAIESMDDPERDDPTVAAINAADAGDRDPAPVLSEEYPPALSMLTPEAESFDVLLYLVPDHGTVDYAAIVPQKNTVLPADEADRTPVRFSAITDAGAVNFDKYGPLPAATFAAWWDETDPAKRTAILLPYGSDTHPAGQKPTNRQIDAAAIHFPYAYGTDVWSAGILAIPTDAAKRSGATRSGGSAKNAKRTAAIDLLMARKRPAPATEEATEEATEATEATI